MSNNIVQGLTDSFRLSLLNNYFSTSTINIALYGPTMALTNLTTAYTSAGEIVSSGYVAGGQALTGQTAAGALGLAWMQWNNPTWTLAVGTKVRGCLFYNVSKGNESVLVLDFGTSRFPNAAGVFTVAFPTNSSVNAVLRLA